VFSGISVLNFPELHEESIPELAFMRAASKMMQVGALNHLATHTLCGGFWK
jgi:hypothetical protein